MKYPIAIEWGDEKTATGIVIPDIPGANTAGDSFDEAYQNALEVAALMLDELVRKGIDVPTASSIEDLRQDSGYEGWGWGMIEIDLTPFLGKTEKVNVTLPKGLIEKIDEYVKRNNTKSRSAFLADSAYQFLRK